MLPGTIRKLNQLNATFYQKVATSFSSSRQTPWPGWRTSWEEVRLLVLNHVTAQLPTLSICDVGCGNGRFGQFVAEQLNDPVKLEYLGIDQDETLLTDAVRSLQDNDSNTFQFEQNDIVENLLSDQSIVNNKQMYQLVVCFGVIHHIPSQVLRQKCMSQLARLVEKNGLLILTCWQFDKNPSLMSRQLTAEEADFTPSNLEENDYFLTWERNTIATRYCHLVTKEEQDVLVKVSGLKLVSSFSADGKTNDQNKYLILQKI